MALFTSLAAVKAYAGVKIGVDDSEIVGIIDAVSSAMANLVGHNYEPDPIIGETHSGPYSIGLVLKKQPVSIEEVRISGGVIAASGYSITEGSRILFRVSSNSAIGWESGSRNIEVDYTPISTVPADIELAAREMASFMIKQSSFTVGGGRLGLGSQSNGDTGTADYFTKTLEALPMVQSVLRRYKRFA